MSNTNQQLAKTSEKTFDAVINKIGTLEQTGSIKLPSDYSAENAVRSAFLILQETKDKGGKPVLEACSKESIANSLLKMVVMGLNPFKRQCSFVAYGGKLELMVEYQGKIAIAKRVGGLKSIVANIVYDGDEFEMAIDENGITKVTKHKQSFKSLGGKIKGAYAVYTLDDGSVNTEVMTMLQIQAAWEQGASKGKSPAHRNFPDQMAKKSVISRALKTVINSSDDSALYEDDVPTHTPTEAYVQAEIKENAHKEEIGFEDVEDIKEEPQVEEKEATNDQAQNMPDFEEPQKKEAEQVTMTGPDF